MSVKKIIQESLDKNPLGVKEALEEALQDRVRVAIEEKYEEMMEANEELEEAHGVFRKGGSIGEVGKNHEPIKVHDNHADAKAHAKRLNSQLSAGEKKHYGLGYHVKPIKEYFDLEELEDFMMSEDFDQLDELSKKTLSSYVKKAKKNKDYHDREADAAHHDDRMADASDHKARSIGREMGIDKAKKKMKESFDLSDLTLEELEDFMMSEDFDQLDELSKKKLTQYQQAAHDEIERTSKSASGRDAPKYKQRMKGMKMSGAKMSLGSSNPYARANAKHQGTAKVAATESFDLSEDTMHVDIDHMGGHDAMAKKHNISLASHKHGTYAVGKKKDLQKYLTHHYDGDHGEAKSQHPEVYK